MSYSDDSLRTLIGQHFEEVYFNAIPLKNGSLHFQSLILKRASIVGILFPSFTKLKESIKWKRFVQHILRFLKTAVMVVFVIIRLSFKKKEYIY